MPSVIKKCEVKLLILFYFLHFVVRGYGLFAFIFVRENSNSTFYPFFSVVCIIILEGI